MEKVRKTGRIEVNLVKIFVLPTSVCAKCFGIETEDEDKDRSFITVCIVKRSRMYLDSL